MNAFKTRQFIVITPLTLVLLFFFSSANAVRVVDLYEAAVPVANQAPEARISALREILRRVIIKVTGESVLPNNPALEAVKISHMVEQFGYESRHKTPNAERKLYLWAKLNPTGVKQLIRQSGLPIWPEERPATLIWLAIEDKAGRLIVAEDSAHLVIDELRLAAGQRGLPAVLPLMDLEESALVGFEAIVNMQDGLLQPASEKYDSQYILIGYIQHVEDDLWRGRWKIAGEGEQAITTATGPLADVVSSGINPLASRIANQFSSYAYVDSEQYIELAIDDITGAAQYARSLKYLQSLSLVSQVEVVGVDHRAVNFRLHTRADLAAVLKVIGLGRVLYPRETVDQLVFGLNP